MECPYCKYIDGWDNERDKDVKGDDGSFYSISNNIKMEREFSCDLVLFGCPRCKKIFMKW